MGLVPNYPQTNMKFKLNENCEAEGTTDHATLLRLLFIGRIVARNAHSGISTLRLEIGTLGFFQWFCDVYGHTKPLGIGSKYYGWGFLIGGWITYG